MFNLSAALMDACVLAIVSRGDTYGYAITQMVQRFFDVSESTLYPVLRRLQKDGLLSTYDQPFQGRNRRYYGITAEGREKLITCVQQWAVYKDKVDTIFEGGDDGAREILDQA